MTDHEAAETDCDTIDRFQLSNQILETNIVCAFDRPVVVGSLSAVGCMTKTTKIAKSSLLCCRSGNTTSVGAVEAVNDLRDLQRHERWGHQNLWDAK